MAEPMVCMKCGGNTNSHIFPCQCKPAADPAQSAPSAERFVANFPNKFASVAELCEAYAAKERDAVEMKWENMEASLCPEDVGFAEWIDVLTRRAEKAEERLQQDLEAIAGDIQDTINAFDEEHSELDKKLIHDILKRHFSSVEEYPYQQFRADSYKQMCAAAETRAETAESALREARQKAIQECMVIAKEEREREFKHEKLGLVAQRKLSRYGAGCCHRIQKNMRALLTVASQTPEEK